MVDASNHRWVAVVTKAYCVSDAFEDLLKGARDRRVFFVTLLRVVISHPLRRSLSF